MHRSHLSLFSALISDPGRECEVPSPAAEPAAASHGEQGVWQGGAGGPWGLRAWVFSTLHEALGQEPRKWRVAGEVGGVSFGTCSPFSNLPSSLWDETILRKKKIAGKEEKPAFQVLRGPVMSPCSFDLRECRSLAPVVAAPGKKG